MESTFWWIFNNFIQHIYFIKDTQWVVITVTNLFSLNKVTKSMVLMKFKIL